MSTFKTLKPSTLSREAFVAAFAEKFPQAAILVTGVEDPDARAHGANESLHLGEFEKVCVAEAVLLARLGALPRG